MGSAIFSFSKEHGNSGAKQMEQDFPIIPGNPRKEGGFSFCAENAIDPVVNAMEQTFPLNIFRFFRNDPFALSH